jgi:hypothetical protein
VNPMCDQVNRRKLSENRLMYKCQTGLGETDQKSADKLPMATALTIKDIIMAWNLHDRYARARVEHLVLSGHLERVDRWHYRRVEP